METIINNPSPAPPTSRIRPPRATRTAPTSRGAGTTHGTTHAATNGAMAATTTRKRRHAAKGSRIAALTLSLAATTGLTAAFANADRADAATKVSTATTAKTAATTATKTYTGAVDTNKWGPVQVKITTSAGRITNVVALQTPNSKPKSVSINNRAIPVLKSEVLTAQSSDIDNVSGATYTTDSYKVSLQNAIDQAIAAGALASA